MSVSVYRTVHHRQHDLGRAEALWLINHCDVDNDNRGIILVCKDRVAEYIQSAKDCEADGCGCEGFKRVGDIDPDHWGPSAEDHKEITAKMPSIFNALFADAIDDFVTLEISW